MAVTARLMQPDWSCRSDIVLLVTRLVLGAFLLWGVADNITSGARMAEFARFLAANGFPTPALMAPLSVWAQAAIGAGLILGLLTRWAGLLCAAHFLVAIAMVDATLGIRGAFPATALVLFGLLFATLGAGRYAAVDRWLAGR